MKMLKMNDYKKLLLLSFLLLNIIAEGKSLKHFDLSNDDKDSCILLNIRIDSTETSYYLSNGLDSLVAGLEDGKWCIRYKGIQSKFLEFSVKNKQLNGIISKYHTNGILSRIASYDMGVVIGVIATWGRDGKLWKVIEYSKGVPVKEFLFNENELLYRVIYYSGKKVGTKTFKKPKPIPEEYKHLINFGDSK
jgi:antitoxin component YwqK of YwqJK toxin-antitoxin module